MQTTAFRQNSSRKPHSYSTLLLATVLITAPALFPTQCFSQVAISLGVQEMYDDNVFLEDDKERSSFVIVDDQFETDFNDGEVPTVLSDELDGKKDDDFITNITISFAGQSPYLTNYMQNQFQLGAGLIFFAEYDDENRITLDGTLDTSLSNLILPEPFYFSIQNAFRSNTSDGISSAEGTATRTTQSYALTGRLGVANLPVARNTSWGLGYTGTYNVYLGELRFEDSTPGEIEEEGSDYHQHTMGTNLDYQVSPSLVVGFSGEAGVQLFTNVETNDIDRETRSESDLDRTQYTGRFNLRYAPDKKFSLTSYIGATLSEYMDTPEPVTVTVVADDGKTQTVVLERDDSETSLIFGAQMAYSFNPGTQLVLGVDQNVGTDIDGDRITSRSVFSNGAIALTDQFSLNLSARYLEYSSTDDLDQATERYELSSSLNYLITQQVSLLLGYNYVDQSADEPFSQSALLTRSQDYDAHRVFVGVNVGILGLPG